MQAITFSRDAIEEREDLSVHTVKKCVQYHELSCVVKVPMPEHTPLLKDL